MLRIAAAALAACLSLAAMPALAQSTVAVTAGERTVQIALPDGYADLASLSAAQAEEFLGFVAEGETGLLVIVPEDIDVDSAWRSSNFYVMASVLDNSLGGTISGPDFRSQIDFLLNGLNDMSPMTMNEGASFVDSVIAGGERPPKLADSGDLEGLQVIGYSEEVNGAAVTITYPIPDGTLLINDLGFVLLNGQVFKFAAFGVLQDTGTTAALQALTLALRAGTLAAN